jgi:hypothetical protein
MIFGKFQPVKQKNIYTPGPTKIHGVAAGTVERGEGKLTFRVLFPFPVL